MNKVVYEFQSQSVMWCLFLISANVLYDTSHSFSYILIQNTFLSTHENFGFYLGGQLALLVYNEISKVRPQTANVLKAWETNWLKVNKK